MLKSEDIKVGLQVGIMNRGYPLAVGVVTRVTSTQFVVRRGNIDQRFRLKSLSEVSGSRWYKDWLVDMEEFNARQMEHTKQQDTQRAWSELHYAAGHKSLKDARAALEKLEALLKE